MGTCTSTLRRKSPLRAPLFQASTLHALVANFGQPPSWKWPKVSPILDRPPCSSPVGAILWILWSRRTESKMIRWKNVSMTAWKQFYDVIEKCFARIENFESGIVFHSKLHTSQEESKLIFLSPRRFNQRCGEVVFAGKKCCCCYCFVLLLVWINHVLDGCSYSHQGSHESFHGDTTSYVCGLDDQLSW